MIGRTILHYTITARLGSGAMGQVYLAHDTRTDRKVALKFLGGESAADAEARQRLTREARATARLSHPGIVAVHGLEEAEGHLFLVQEYVEGETLAARLERGPLDPPECLRLARELTASLAHAHAQGVLHRDLKPENVLVATDGSFKIADFGIARLEGASTLTRVGTVMGSLPYLAPERLRGNSGDARADLFALGAIFYEVMSGRRAFGGSTEAEVMHRVMNEPPPPLEVASASLEPLLQLTLRLLAKEPRERPASAEVVAGMLEGAGTAARAAARRARWWLPAAAALGVVAIGVVVAWMRARQASGPEGPPPVAVLYFENVTDPADHARIGSITGNLLITSLAQTADLNVLSTQRVLDAMRQLGQKGGSVDRGVALAVARKARARRIVTGSILQTEPSIVMTAEVSDVESGKVLNATRVEGQPGQSVFQVVDALSAQLLQRMVRAAETTRLAPVAQRTSTDLEAQRRYAEGLEALSGGRLEEAVAAFRAAVGRDSQFAQAYYQLAIAEWWYAEPANARGSIAHAKLLSDRLSPLERGMVDGLESLVNGRYGTASKQFAALAGTDPNEKLVHYGQVESSYHGRRWPQAVESARKSMALDPDFTLAGVHLVDALRASGQLDEAESGCRALLRKDSKNALLWHSLFDVMLDRADPGGALRAADQAMAEGAMFFLVSGGAATLLFNRTGKVETERWRVAADSMPWQKEDERLGIAYVRALRRGRFREALRLVPGAWKIVPLAVPSGPSVPMANGMEAATGARDVAAALQWADSAGSRLERWGGPGFSQGRRVITLLAQSQLGLIPEAAATLKKMEARPLNDLEMRLLSYCRARVLEGQGRHRESLEELRNAEWPGAPWNKFGGLRLARARAEMGAEMYTEALGVLDTLILMPLMSPDNAVRLHFYRGQVMEKLRRLDESAASYREFLRLWKDADPGTPEVEEARAALVRLERATQKAATPGR